MSSSPTFASGVSEDLLDKFFSTPTSTGVPGLPGPTHVSTQAVLEVLRHDFKSHSPFVNRVRFHKDVYKTHLPVLQPTLVSPVPITQENFIEHLDDERYYDGYLAFFTDYLQSHSPIEALERFIFSPEYNFRADLAAADGPDSEEKVQPQMLNRFLAGLIHPFIHVAYGLEFGIIGQVVEGLAQAAHSLEIAGFGTSPSASAPEKRPTFAFHRRLPTVVKSIGGAIYDLVREWTEERCGGAGAEARLRGMVEEVVWGNVIWYGIGGWGSRGTSGRGMNADFFNAHLVTSALFLPKLIVKEKSSGSSTPGLSFASRLLLLQTYLAVSAAWYVRRGCHALPIADFYAATDAQLSAPAGDGTGAGWRQAPGSAWPRVIESGVRFPDEHAPKIARALVDFATRWGTRPPGYFSAFAATGEEKARTGAGRALALEGIERLDGTLFVRVAGLTFDRLGWVDEREKAGHWDRDGIPMLDEWNAGKSA
ncbi:hypothetical protein EDB83DRAFT_2481591 [Lactarius deliciosus]|nr:hypothetical protein EDB83DRAFT_2481591 [Lactarius deliciosus]